MTLFAVKGFDDDNNEIISTISMTVEDVQFKSVLPSIRKLLSENNDQNLPQGWIYEDKYIVFSYSKTAHILFVAIASNNTSFAKLKHFLELLENSWKNRTVETRESMSSKEFQDLCDSLINYVVSQPYLNIALLGLGRSGKTTFLQHYGPEQQLTGFNSYTPTRLVNIVVIDNLLQNSSIRFYDLGIAFQDHWWKFSLDSDGYIFFVDMSDSKSIRASKDLLEEVRNFWDLPFVIAANKIDVSTIKNTQRYLSRKLLVPRNSIYEVETQTGFGMTPLLEGLLSKIQKKTTFSPVVQSRRSKTKRTE
jgi:hypothetical protein